jgi:Ion channel
LKNKRVVKNFWYRHRIEIIMWIFIAELLASPIPDYHRRAGAPLSLLALCTLLLGTSIVGSRKVIRYAVFPAAAIWLIARLLEAFGNPQHLYAQLAPVAGLLLSCSLLWAIFDHFNSVPRLPRSAIAEAFISYLIIAIAFSQVYWILNRVVDHPFNQVIPESQSGTLLYFSMITLSSVGYGGILPINPFLRMVAALESMTGIFFVAVVVARLVSSYRPKTRPLPHGVSAPNVEGQSDED